MLKIRLQRVGKRGQAMYRLVVAEHTKNPKGAYLELLGSYNPHAKDLQANADRVKHWLGNGAKMSDTVNNLLVSKNVVEGKKIEIKLKSKKKQSEPEKTPAAPVAEPGQAGKAETETKSDGSESAPSENELQKPEEKVDDKTEEPKKEPKSEEEKPAGKEKADDKEDKADKEESKPEEENKVKNGDSEQDKKDSE